MSTPANESAREVRIGIIGVGNMGAHHATYMNKIAGCRLTALCDIDEKRLNEVAAKSAPDAQRFTSAHALYESGETDAVLIATPHYDHPSLVKDAFTRGLHVLCEKPLAVTVGAARALQGDYADAVKRTPDLKFAIMFQQRTRPIYRKMRELLANGAIGELRRITWLVTDWFRTWTYYASGGWRATWAGEGGGVLLNQCPHNLDLLQWLIGGAMPKRVTAIAKIAKTHPIEVEDDVSAILEYENGAVGHFVTTTGELPGTNRLEIVGDRGALVSEKGKLLLRSIKGSTDEILRDSPESFPKTDVTERDVALDGLPDGHHIIAENFIRGITTGEALIAPGTEGPKGLEIGNAMLMAGLTRKAVELPLDASAYDAFLADVTKRYSGKKTLAPREETRPHQNVSASFAK